MYNEFFGLNRSAFDLSPDPFFMFPSERVRPRWPQFRSLYAAAKALWS